LKILRKRKFISFIVIIFLLVAGGIRLLLYRSQYLLFKDPIIEATAKIIFIKVGESIKQKRQNLNIFKSMIIPCNI